MTSLNKEELRADLKFVKQMFGDAAESPFRIVNANMDEMECYFDAPQRCRTYMSVSFRLPYPKQSAVWYTSTDEALFGDLLETVSQAEGMSVRDQIYQIVTTLCGHFNMQTPSFLKSLPKPYDTTDVPCTSSDVIAAGVVKKSDEDEEEETDEDEGETSDLCFDVFSVTCESESKPAAVVGERAKELDIQIKKVKQLTEMRSAETGGFGGGVSAAATRLMKDLCEIKNSTSFENDVFDVELESDSLMEWYVKLKKVDPDSRLAKDLIKLKNLTGQDFVLLHFTFPQRYPFEPPFVRVVSPYVVDGFILKGGALCMELLTPEGWSSVYSVESVILQISATLTKGNAGIEFNAVSNFSMSAAWGSFQSARSLHQNGKWYTPPVEEG